MNWYDKEKLESRSKTAAFLRKGDPSFVASSQDNAEDDFMDKEAAFNKEATILRIRKRTTMGEVFAAYVAHVAEQVQNENAEFKNMTFEIRGSNDLGFRFTEFDETGEKIIFFADCAFSLAPEYIRVSIKGARQSASFSESLRLFLSDPAMKTSRRIASLIRRK